MDIQTERKIVVNKWIINARWFWMVGIFIIGIATKLLSETNIAFSFSAMTLFVVLGFFINIIFYLLIKKIKKSKIPKGLNLLSEVQIATELIFFLAIMHNAGGIDSIAMTFFFLPIVSSSLILNTKGSIATAILSGILVNILVILEYYKIIPHINRFEVETHMYQNFAISLTATSMISLFYIIIGTFAGFGSKLLFDRERKLLEKKENLKKEKKYRENELQQLAKTTKLLVKRDLELTATNKELDKKVKELERSEKAMLNIFSDLKEERKRSVEAHNKVVAIINNFIDPIIVIDKESKISLLNPAAKYVFKLIDSDLGKKIIKDNNYSLNNFKKIIRKSYKVKSSKEIKSHDPNEEEVVIEYEGQELTYKVISAEVLDNENKYLGTMKIFYNLTREKMIDRMKSEFISIAAHQLRTPLAAIKWTIKMVLDQDAGRINKEQQGLLVKGYKSNERVICLVNDMLNVSRIEEGRFNYTFSNFNFKELLDMVIGSLDNQIKEKRINFLLQIPKKLPTVYMDKEKITLVLQNILENAVKYTPEFGKVEVKVEKKEKFLKVIIKDNGVGIPAEDQHKLFTKFFRGANVMRMQTEGSGLGLFIVKNIMQRHGGKISCQSKEGQGTEFILILPIG